MSKVPGLLSEEARLECIRGGLLLMAGLHSCPAWRPEAGKPSVGTGAVRSWQRAFPSVNWRQSQKSPWRTAERGLPQRSLSSLHHVQHLADLLPDSGAQPTSGETALQGGRGRNAPGAVVKFKLNTHMNLLNPDCVKGWWSGRRGVAGGQGTR